MVEWITSWAQGIIIAVIIATIIEMILPDGNCKKYIKVVIGVYILFSIVSPVITKITGKNFNISEEFNLEKFYSEADSKSIYNDLNSNNSSNIKDIYIANLKTDINSKLKNKGYDVVSCNIEIKDDETYEIKTLNLTLKKVNEETDNNEENSIVNKVEEINSIKIEIGNNENNNNETTNTKDYNSDLTAYEKNKVKEYLESTYEISKENININ
jgi:stage III sporulation protein AF